MFRSTPVLFALAFTYCLPLTGSAAAQSGDALYVVPVESHLADVATLPMVEGDFRVDGERMILSYKLPEDLVGDEPVVNVMSGLAAPDERGFIALTGGRGEAACLHSLAGLTCAMRLAPVTHDVERVRNLLTTKYADDARLADRIRVAEIFAADPIGTLSITRSAP